MSRLEQQPKFSSKNRPCPPRGETQPTVEDSQMNPMVSPLVQSGTAASALRVAPETTAGQGAPPAPSENGSPQPPSAPPRKTHGLPAAAAASGDHKHWLTPATRQSGQTEQTSTAPGSKDVSRRRLTHDRDDKRPTPVTRTRKSSSPPPTAPPRTAMISGGAQATKYSDTSRLGANAAPVKPRVSRRHRERELPQRSEARAAAVPATATTTTTATAEVTTPKAKLRRTVGGEGTSTSQRRQLAAEKSRPGHVLEDHVCVADAAFGASQSDDDVIKVPKQASIVRTEPTSARDLQFISSGLSSAFRAAVDAIFQWKPRAAKRKRQRGAARGTDVVATLPLPQRAASTAEEADLAPMHHSSERSLLRDSDTDNHHAECTSHQPAFVFCFTPDNNPSPQTTPAKAIQTEPATESILSDTCFPRVPTEAFSKPPRHPPLTVSLNVLQPTASLKTAELRWEESAAPGAVPVPRKGPSTSAMLEHAIANAESSSFTAKPKASHEPASSLGLSRCAIHEQTEKMPFSITATSRETLVFQAAKTNSAMAAAPNNAAAQSSAASALSVAGQRSFWSSQSNTTGTDTQAKPLPPSLPVIPKIQVKMGEESPKELLIEEAESDEIVTLESETPKATNTLHADTETLYEGKSSISNIETARYSSGWPHPNKAPRAKRASSMNNAAAAPTPAAPSAAASRPAVIGAKGCPPGTIPNKTSTKEAGAMSATHGHPNQQSPETAAPSGVKCVQVEPRRCKSPEKMRYSPLGLPATESRCESASRCKIAVVKKATIGTPHESRLFSLLFDGPKRETANGSLLPSPPGTPTTQTPPHRARPATATSSKRKTLKMRPLVASFKRDAQSALSNSWSPHDIVFSPAGILPPDTVIPPGSNECYPPAKRDLTASVKQGPGTCLKIVSPTSQQQSGLASEKSPHTIASLSPSASGQVPLHLPEARAATPSGSVKSGTVKLPIYRLLVGSVGKPHPNTASSASSTASKETKKFLEKHDHASESQTKSANASLVKPGAVGQLRVQQLSEKPKEGGPNEEKKATVIKASEPIGHAENVQQKLSSAAPPTPSTPPEGNEESPANPSPRSTPGSQPNSTNSTPVKSGVTAPLPESDVNTATDAKNVPEQPGEGGCMDEKTTGEAKEPRPSGNVEAAQTNLNGTIPPIASALPKEATSAPSKESTQRPPLTSQTNNKSPDVAAEVPMHGTKPADGTQMLSEKPAQDGLTSGIHVSQVKDTSLSEPPRTMQDPTSKAQSQNVLQSGNDSPKANMDYHHSGILEANHPNVPLTGSNNVSENISPNQGFQNQVSGVQPCGQNNVSKPTLDVQPSDVPGTPDTNILPLTHMDDFINKLLHTSDHKIPLEGEAKLPKVFLPKRNEISSLQCSPQPAPASHAQQTSEEFSHNEGHRVDSNAPRQLKTRHHELFREVGVPQRILASATPTDRCAKGHNNVLLFVETEGEAKLPKVFPVVPAGKEQQTPITAESPEAPYSATASPALSSQLPSPPAHGTELAGPWKQAPKSPNIMYTAATSAAPIGERITPRAEPAGSGPRRTKVPPVKGAAAKAQQDYQARDIAQPSGEESSIVKLSELRTESDVDVEYPEFRPYAAMFTRPSPTLGRAVPPEKKKKIKQQDVSPPSVAVGPKIDELSPKVSTPGSPNILTEVLQKNVKSETGTVPQQHDAQMAAQPVAQPPADGEEDNTSAALCLLVALLLALALLFIGLIYVVTATWGTVATESPTGTVPSDISTHADLLYCSSEFCDREGDYIKSLIDVSAVGPCDNFYEHVCGSWAKLHPLGGSKAAVGIVSTDTIIQDRLVDKVLELLASNKEKDVGLAVSLYDACVDPKKATAAPTTVKELFKTWTIQQWPREAIATTKEMWMFAGEILRDVGLPTLLDVAMIESFRETDVSVVELRKPKHVFSSNDASRPVVTAQFRDAMNDVASAFSQTPNAKQVDEVMTVLIRLGSTPPEPTIAELEQLKLGGYVSVRLSNLDAAVTDFLRVVMNNAANLNSSTTVFLRSPRYIRSHLPAALGELTARAVMNYVGFLVLIRIAPFLPDKHRALRQLFCKDLRGRIFTSVNNSDVLCFMAVETVLPSCLTKLSTQVLDSHELLANTLAKLEKIFSRHIPNLAWMNEYEALVHRYQLKRRQAASFGHGNDSCFANAAASSYPKDNPVQFYCAVARSQQEARLRGYNASSLAPISLSPLRTQASYDASRRRVRIPTALFNASVPSNSSAFMLHLSRYAVRFYRGMVEKLFDTAYEADSLRFADDIHKLEFLLNCFERDLGHLPSSIKGRAPPDPALSRGAALQQTVALQLAYRAFQEMSLEHHLPSAYFRYAKLPEMSADQLFFVYYALDNCESSDETYQDPASHWLPAPYRVNLPLRHLVEFAPLFGCPDTGMAHFPQGRRSSCAVVLPDSWTPRA